MFKIKSFSLLRLVTVSAALASAIILTSCTSETRANDDEVAKTPTSIVAPSTAINSVNKNSFNIEINCPSTVKRIDVTGSITSSIACQSAPFTASLDLSSVPDGMVSLTFTPNNGPPVQFSYVKDVTAPIVTGLVSDVTPSATKAWTWDCDETNKPCTYRYAIDKSPVYVFTVESFSAVTTASKLTGSGTYFIHVQARDSYGNISSTVSVSAALSNPTPPTIYITSPGTTETNSGTVGLQLFADSLNNEMYVTNTPGCASGGVWETYSPDKSWALNGAQIDATATVYVKFRKPSLAETACVSDTITWRSYNTACTDTSSAATSGLIYDEGGPSANYPNSFNFCGFNFNAAAPISFNINSMALYENDEVTFSDSLSKYVFRGTGTGTTRVEIYRSAVQQSVSVMNSMTNYNFSLTGTGASLLVYTGGSGAAAGFDVAWKNSNVLPTPQGNSPIGSLQINSGAATTTLQNVNLNINYGILPEMYITNTPGCSAGGTWEEFASSRPWTLSGGEGLKTVFIKFRDSFLHESTRCEQAQIYLDQSAPLAPMILALGVATTNTIAPSIYFLNTDTISAIGLAEARILRASDNFVVKDWTTLTSSDELTGLSLQTGVDYYFELRAYDLAGNISATSQSVLWSIKPFISIRAVGETLLAENVGTVNFQITSTAILNFSISVPFVVNGEATVPADHDLLSGTAVIAGGQSSVTVPITIVDDATAEPNERLRISLQPAVTQSYSLEGYTQLEYMILSSDGGSASATVTNLATGLNHACVAANGGVQCWGDNSSGGLGNGTTVSSVVPVQTIASGSGATQASVNQGFRSCAVVAGGVRCWGSNGAGGLGDGTTTTRTSPVTAIAGGSGVTVVSNGLSHTCAVQSGGVRCWGGNSNGQIGDGTMTTRLSPVNIIAAASGATDVSGGDLNTCAVINGGVQCWGNNSGGQIGDGTTTARLTPVSVIAPGSGATSVSVGSYHACAVVNGGVQCWGYNLNGELGNGTTISSSLPVTAIPSGSAATSVVAAGSFTCAMVGGSVRCWGSNSSGQLGDGTRISKASPIITVDSSRNPLSVSLGVKHACVRFTNGMQCWGDNYYGQLGDSSPQFTSTPAIKIADGSGVTAISAEAKSFAAVVNGGIQSWGTNLSRQVGDGTSAFKPSPVWVKATGSGVSAASAGANVKCSLAGGGVQCWGLNIYGELGVGDTGSTFSSGVPITVIAAGGGATAVAAGTYSACAIVSGGIKCWGSNGNGRLGDGTETNRLTPTTIFPPGSLATDISTKATTCAVINGGVQCWGFGFYGQVGNGTSNFSQLTPAIAIASGSLATAVSVGPNHVCAVVNGGLRCWGSNASGNLGDGTAVDKNIPTTIFSSGSLVTAVSAGESHTCAVIDGGLRCWGSNAFGQLGNGTTVSSLTPVTIFAAGSGVTAVAAGSSSTCAVVNGGLRCWGDNTQGLITGDAKMHSGFNWVFSILP